MSDAAVAQDHLSALMERIQAADRAIDEARTQIVHQSVVFADRFAGDLDEGHAAPPDIEEAVHSFETAAQGLAEAVGHELTQTAQQFRDALNEHETAWTALAAHWSEQCNGAHTALQGLEQAVHDAGHQIEQAIGSLEQHYQEGGQTLAAAGHALEEAVTALAKVLEQDLTQKFEESAEAYGSELSGDLTHTVETTVQAARDAADQVIQQLVDTAQQLLTDFSNTLETALTGLASHVAEHARGEVERVFHEAVETAVKELMASIMQSVAASEIGAEVTAAMAPYLPELIAAKKLTDVILDAIRIWKETIGRLTSLFG